MDVKQYCDNLFEYQRLSTHEVPVGELVIGGNAPIRIQSMTTTNTLDTQASIDQCIRIIEAGGQLVRLTTQGKNEAANLQHIIEGLRARGYVAPIVADVHFNPSAAETAAHYAEKVRINPGNYTGEAKKFDTQADTLTDKQWHDLIVEKLKPLVQTCKEHETTLRIGVNHGSLSDRIMAKYGDTSEGMTASCIEYIDALESLDFSDIVISIKASNTRIMVQTVRLLAATMKQRGRIYPLHLGVTEAGSDTEGRIKSAVGIGALLVDGLGDTIRVSLTEAPEAEVPVAQALVDYIATKKGKLNLPTIDASSYSPYEYNKRQTIEVVKGLIGGNNKPVMVVDTTGRKQTLRCNASVVYTNDAVNDEGLFISDQAALYTQHSNCLPLLSAVNLAQYKGTAFVRLSFGALTDEVISELRNRTDLVIVHQPQTNNPTVETRAFVLKLNELGIRLPVVAWLRYTSTTLDAFQLEAATDAGLLFIDGLIDGLMLSNYNIDQPTIAAVNAEIMQASRVNFSKAEFISCPACGRTLYDIQRATRAIKDKFVHLKGLKIAVMGCIVNGIGEMADADYGYVGAGPGKISLYRAKELIKKALPEAQAIEELVQLIKDDGLWTEPQ